MVPPTVTVTVLQAVQEAFKRAEKTGRTQQIELGTDLYIRINTAGGRKFLLFQLEGTPEEAFGHALAQALEFKNYQVGWHQGATLKSLTVEEG
ncbi:hypothetical protein [Deinococcus cellulosilyticus]|uniref:Uncharacterized protein n=1 Tax=Deinococcus cellulosilyticus (strain DSM 18568 / NBRC 106333 / KACC 11606 / 5516J-15) TaxID=1223518 RepID=A0A511N3N3_DEIC1|nr:hypothetical protein [Deinococcus cellulosilyticus]GEM47479.1 hypothetical protein DC3_31140 [Deinococcus cellulosilyticus NBRC 106333 = KACC 11606]